MATNYIFGQDGFSPYLYCADLLAYIYFPALPESYEIARENDFDTGEKIPLFPDGLIAIYKGSDLIHVPISFEVHASDPRCVDGPLTLIGAAKALHAMALPAVPDAAIQGLTLSYTLNKSQSEPTLAQSSPLAQASATDLNASGTVNYYMPPMVQLVLFESQTNGINSEQAGMGINMKGFLKSVKVTPRGPWLRAASYTGRLPSSMEYSFTFVYFPSYTPTPSLGGFKAATSTGVSVAKFFYGSSAVVSVENSATVNTAGTAAPATGVSASQTAQAVVNQQGIIQNGQGAGFSLLNLNTGQGTPISSRPTPHEFDLP